MCVCSWERERERVPPVQNWANPIPLWLYYILCFGQRKLEELLSFMSGLCVRILDGDGAVWCIQHLLIIGKIRWNKKHFVVCFGTQTVQRLLSCLNGFFLLFWNYLMSSHSLENINSKNYVFVLILRLEWCELSHLFLPDRRWDLGNSCFRWSNVCLSTGHELYEFIDGEGLERKQRKVRGDRGEWVCVRE